MIIDHEQRAFDHHTETAESLAAQAVELAELAERADRIEAETESNHPTGDDWHDETVVGPQLSMPGSAAADMKMSAALVHATLAGNYAMIIAERAAT